MKDQVMNAGDEEERYGPEAHSNLNKGKGRVDIWDLASNSDYDDLERKVKTDNHLKMSQSEMDDSELTSSSERSR